MKGVDGIIHTASLVLLSTGELKGMHYLYVLFRCSVTLSEIVEPAVNGVVGILTSALKYGCVLTRELRSKEF